MVVLHGAIYGISNIVDAKYPIHQYQFIYSEIDVSKAVYAFPIHQSTLLRHSPFTLRKRRSLVYEYYPEPKTPNQKTCTDHSFIIEQIYLPEFNT